MVRTDFNLNWKWKKEGTEHWQQVTLPHDAMLYEERREDAPSTNAGGYFLGGKYVYEKKFVVPAEWSGDYIAVEFEGVYQKSEVFVNGKKAGGCVYGYIPFEVEIGTFLNFGKENTITVTVDNEDTPNTRWYTGSGIYRPVHFLHADKTRILSHGIKVTTLSYQPARVRIETLTTGGEVELAIYESENLEYVVAKASGNCVELDVPNAKLWSEHAPNLYVCKATLTVDGKVTDTAETTFGIRKVEWNTNGLFINGENTLLRGGCVHHDNGVVGACCYEEAEERRVRLMKEYGYNAIRSSHNPTSEAMLRACDKYGVYMMDETWDMWYYHKNKYDYATYFMDHYKEDIDAMVARDFSHPSVIMYSIANEISEPKDEKGVALAKEIVDYVHSLDDSRAVTGGINLMLIYMASRGQGVYKEDGGRKDQDKQKKKNEKPKKQKASGSLFFNMMTSIIGTNMNKMTNNATLDKRTTPVLDALDIAGYNYASGRYAIEGKKHPNRVVVGSETFPMDIAKNWEMVKKYPYLIGDFMWTSWDYLGEAGIGAWTYTPDGASFDKPYPWLLADVGAIDILGNPGAEVFYAKTVWGLEKKPYIGVRPVNHPGITVRKATWRGSNAFACWSWKNCEGNKAEVEVYADAATIELFLNGKSLGKKKVKQYKTLFKLKYQPGTLTAIAYDASGNELGRSELSTKVGESRLSVIPEVTEAKAGEVIFVPICITGENGVVEANDDCTVKVEVTGGELLGFGSATPSTTESFLSGSYTTYYGRALAVVRAGESGKITVKAMAPGMTQAEACVKIS